MRLSARLASALALSAVVATAPGLASAQTLLRDAEIEDTLRDWSDPIFEAAGLEPRDIDIYLVGDRTMNAFVTGGQNTFYHTGLIMEAETPNQLKGVIAHETGHIAGGDLARSTEAMRNAMVPAYITMALGILAMASGAGDAGAALLASSQQFAMLSFFTYTRMQESRADQAALGYLDASGQSGRGLVEFFQKFRYQEVLSEARRAPYFRSHPLSTDRINALTRRVEEMANKDVADSPADIERLKMMQAKIHGFMYTPQQTFTRFPAADRSLPARYARAIAAYRAPDLRMAMSLTQELIDGQPDNPYFHELMAQMLFENGRVQDSIAPGQRAVELAPDEPLLHIGLARSLIAAGGEERLADAERHLRTALRLEPDNAFAWNQTAKVADARGEDGMARLATAEEAFALGDAPRANRFAQAALRNLDRGTPAFQRATDIQSVTARIASRAARDGQGGGRPRNILPSFTSPGAAASMASQGPVVPHDHDHGHAH
jgi:predicted Zn-dependent protease